MLKRNIGHIDWFILLPVLGLLLFSMVFVYSASAPYAIEEFGKVDTLIINHAIRVLASIIVMIFMSKIDYHIYEKLSRPIILFSIALLVAVFIFGSERNGATRWLNLGPISFQPVEFVKFAVVIYFAALLVRKQAVIKTFEDGFLPFIVWLVIVCVLIALQPNFSNMFLVFLIGMIMLFVGNVNLLHLFGVGTIGIAAAAGFLVSANYRLARVLSYFGVGDPDAQSETSWQLKQGLIALGNGGLSGLGPGQSKQSYLFLPESYGDFIFSVIGEEVGFIGLFVIIVAFCIVFYRGMLIAKNSPDLFGYFLAIGITVVLALYLFTNAAVNIGLLPTTGVPLPFISYGGTAVVIYSAAIGILLNISSQARLFHAPTIFAVPPNDKSTNKETKNE